MNVERAAKVAANIGVVVMCASWLGFVVYTIVRDHKQKPVDVLISTVPGPVDPFDRRDVGLD